MNREDWLEYFEAINDRMPTEAEIQQALADGEFIEAQAPVTAQAAPLPNLEPSFDVAEEPFFDGTQAPQANKASTQPSFIDEVLSENRSTVSLTPSGLDNFAEPTQAPTPEPTVAPASDELDVYAEIPEAEVTEMDIFAEAPELDTSQEVNIQEEPVQNNFANAPQQATDYQEPVNQNTPPQAPTPPAPEQEEPIAQQGQANYQQDVQDPAMNQLAQAQQEMYQQQMQGMQQGSEQGQGNYQGAQPQQGMNQFNQQGPGYYQNPQAYSDQPYSGQPYPGQPYPGQPYPGQPYPGGPMMGNAPFGPMAFEGDYSKQFITSFLTFYTKAQVSATADFVNISTPNTILKLIPIGRENQTIPVNQIASVDDAFNVDITSIIFGLALAIGSFFIFADYLIIAIILLLLALIVILSSFERVLQLHLAAGVTYPVAVSMTEKNKLLECRAVIQQKIHDYYSYINNN